MRVLAITPRVDPDHNLLGFVHTWMSRLAQRVERLYILQLWDGISALPDNVTVFSMGKDAGASRARQLARFGRVVGALCLGRRVDAVLAHMGPIFAVCAAPFARAAELPLALWYAHGTVSNTLRLAHVLVNRVGTSTPEGFRIPSPKVRYTGQGIETDRFVPPGQEPCDGPIVSVGRVSPSKDHETLLRALSVLHARGLSPRLQIVGDAQIPSDELYLADLRATCSKLRLDDQVIFRAGVPHRQVAPQYQSAALFASASRTGSLDKAVLEALSCARLAVTSNEAFRDFFGPERSQYTFGTGDHVALADRFEQLLTMTAHERRERGIVLREHVIAQHGVDHLADELVELLRPSSPMLAHTDFTGASKHR